MATNTKHTPGPWRIGRMEILSDTPIENGPYGSNATEFYGGHLVAESVAACNRPLIASAPELLQVAICLLFVVRAMARELDIDPETTEFRFSAKGEHVAELNLQTVYERADETIAKATGSAA